MIGRKNEIIELFKKYGHDKILFVGIDVSKNFHTVTILNGYYDILLKPSTFSIYEEGFKKLTNKINKIFSQSNAQVLVFGCEPSGHYYLNIMSNLKKTYPEGIFKLINPKSTKSNREQMMQYNKTDPIDAYAIADLLIRGEGYNFTKEDTIYKSIKEYVRYLDSLTKEQTRLKNKIHSYLDEIYPGLENELSNFTNTKYGQAFLQILPHPKKLKYMSQADIVLMYQKHGFDIKPKIAKRISDASKKLLIVDNIGLETKLSFLEMIVNQFVYTQNTIQKIEGKLKELLGCLDYSENILQIKGIKVKTLSRIIAYLNNPSRFDNGKQVASFCGLVPKKEQSGKKHGEERISRQGHKKLRSTLVQAAHVAVSNMGYFTAFYNRLVIQGRKDPKLAITATANKLIRIIIHMIKTGEKFNPPTAQNKELAVSKINRLTKKKLEKLTKENRMGSLTQDITDVYLIRV